MKIIDTHVHIYDGNWPPGSPVGLSARQLVAVMDELDIENAWVSPVSGLIQTDVAPFNDALYAFSLQAPERVRQFYVLNPQHPEKTEREMARLEKMQPHGIKLHPWLQAYSVMYPCVEKVMAWCEKQHLPVIFHDGTPPYADSLQIASLAARFPNVPVILGHAGLYDGWRSAVIAAQRCPNIWLCLCGPAMDDICQMVKRIEPHRFLFGSDGGTAISQATFVQRINLMKKALGDEDLLRRIFYDNPRRLVE